MAQKLSVMLFLVVVISAMAQPSEAPCVVTVVGSDLLLSGQVKAFAASSLTADCPEPAVNGFYMVQFVLDRRIPSSSEWERVITWSSERVPASSGELIELSMFANRQLQDGHYALTSFNGSRFLDSVHFVVGGFQDVGDARYANVEWPVLGNVVPSRIVADGYVYFRRKLPGQRVAGHLSQIVNGKIKVFPIWLEQVDTSDQTILVNGQEFKGGLFDQPWARARMPKGDWFILSRPIGVSISWNGSTSQGIVFNPNDPNEYGGGETRVPRPSW